MSKQARCALCGAPAIAPPHKPFCSQGCCDRDLLNWLGGAYVVPAEAIEEDDVPLDTGRDAAL